MQRQKTQLQFQQLQKLMSWSQRQIKEQISDLKIREHAQQTLEQLPIDCFAVALSLNQLQNAGDCPRLNHAVCHDVNAKLFQSQIPARYRPRHFTVSAALSSFSQPLLTFSTHSPPLLALCRLQGWAHSMSRPEIITGDQTWL